MSKYIFSFGDKKPKKLKILEIFWEEKELILLKWQDLVYQFLLVLQSQQKCVKFFIRIKKN